MKKILVALASSFTLFINLPIASAATPVALSEPSHQLLSGVFIDDALAQELAPNGALGRLIYPPSYSYHQNRAWYIDPALIEEVTAMTKSYTVVNTTAGVGSDIAIAWLARLKTVITGSTVYAIPYGNPSEYWVKRITPHDRNYILQSSRDRLSKDLGITVATTESYTSTSYFSLTRHEINSIRRADADLLKFATYMSAEKVDAVKASIYKILNPSLTKERRGLLARDLDGASATLEGTLHLAAGKFTVTSTNQKLPVTIINGFDNQIKVNLRITSTNQRILVANQKNILVTQRFRS